MTDTGAEQEWKSCAKYGGFTGLDIWVRFNVLFQLVVDVVILLMSQLLVEREGVDTNTHPPSKGLTSRNTGVNDLVRQKKSVTVMGHR